MESVGEATRSSSADDVEDWVEKWKVAKRMMERLKKEIGCVRKRRGMERAAAREGFEL